MPQDYTRLLAELSSAYERHAPASAALNRRALEVMVDGGNHALRLIRPFPPRITRVRAAAGASTGRLPGDPRDRLASRRGRC